eukprot:Nk52_evm1s2220 gene=Nk52_evmTU1s2220
MIQKAVAERGVHTVVCSSGGNAGYAVAYACVALHLKVIVVLPASTPVFMQERITSLGGGDNNNNNMVDVRIHGAVWDDAHQYALRLEQELQPGCVYVSPFDHEDIWEGHSTIVDEIVEQFPQAYNEVVGNCRINTNSNNTGAGGCVGSRSRPDAIVVSVGGGGLLCGVVEGLRKHGWLDNNHGRGDNDRKGVRVVAVETPGANCLSAAMRAGELVTLSGITSCAKSLGALRVAEGAFKRCCEMDKDGVFRSRIVTDRQCVRACGRFLDEHRMLVEPACGASLAAVMWNCAEAEGEEMVTGGSDPEEGLSSGAGALDGCENIVVIVCGGQIVDMDMLKKWGVL